jgi:hypothetical protein
MNVTFSHEKLQAALNDDGEFRFAARYWDGALQLQIGAQAHVLRLKGGEVVGIDSTPLDGTSPGEVTVSASADTWAQMLQPFPRPFYQDFYPAYMHHGLEFKGDSDYVWAYYAALRRSGQVLRSIASVEEV